jgi:hypothetical protein
LHEGESGSFADLHLGDETAQSLLVHARYSAARVMRPTATTYWLQAQQLRARRSTQFHA